MSDPVAAELRRLVAIYGPDLARDARRTEALLHDLCGSHRREINLAVVAVRERVAIDLVEASGSDIAVLRQRLVRRLVENDGLANEAAGWAVEIWAAALGLSSWPQPSPRDLEQPAWNEGPLTGPGRDEAMSHGARAPQEIALPADQRFIADNTARTASAGAGRNDRGGDWGYDDLRPLAIPTEPAQRGVRTVHGMPLEVRESHGALSGQLYEILLPPELGSLKVELRADGTLDPQQRMYLNYQLRIWAGMHAWHAGDHFSTWQSRDGGSVHRWHPPAAHQTVTSKTQQGSRLTSTYGSDLTREMDLHLEARQTTVGYDVSLLNDSGQMLIQRTSAFHFAQAGQQLLADFLADEIVRDANAVIRGSYTSHPAYVAGEHRATVGQNAFTARAHGTAPTAPASNSVQHP